jgi:hypothetical protein
MFTSTLDMKDSGIPEEELSRLLWYHGPRGREAVLSGTAFAALTFPETYRWLPDFARASQVVFDDPERSTGFVHQALDAATARRHRDFLICVLFDLAIETGAAVPQHIEQELAQSVAEYQYADDEAMGRLYVAFHYFESRRDADNLCSVAGDYLRVLFQANPAAPGNDTWAIAMLEALSMPFVRETADARRADWGFVYPRMALAAEFIAACASVRRDSSGALAQERVHAVLDQAREVIAAVTMNDSPALKVPESANVSLTLTPGTQALLFSAMQLASRTGFEHTVDAHLLLAMVEPGADLARLVLEEIGIDVDTLRDRLLTYLDGAKPGGSTRIDVLVSNATHRAASTRSPRLTTPHILLAIASTPGDLRDKVLDPASITLDRVLTAVRELGASG